MKRKHLLVIMAILCSIIVLFIACETATPEGEGDSKAISDGDDDGDNENNQDVTIYVGDDEMSCADAANIIYNGECEIELAGYPTLADFMEECTLVGDGSSKWICIVDCVGTFENCEDLQECIDGCLNITDDDVDDDVDDDIDDDVDDDDDDTFTPDERSFEFWFTMEGYDLGEGRIQIVYLSIDESGVVTSSHPWPGSNRDIAPPGEIGEGLDISFCVDFVDYLGEFRLYRDFSNHSRIYLKHDVPGGTDIDIFTPDQGLQGGVVDMKVYPNAYDCGDDDDTDDDVDDDVDDDIDDDVDDDTLDDDDTIDDDTMDDDTVDDDTVDDDDDDTTTVCAEETIIGIFYWRNVDYPGTQYRKQDVNFTLNTDCSLTASHLTDSALYTPPPGQVAEGLNLNLFLNFTSEQVPVQLYMDPLDHYTIRIKDSRTGMAIDNFNPDQGTLGEVQNIKAYPPFTVQ